MKIYIKIIRNNDAFRPNWGLLQVNRTITRLQLQCLVLVPALIDLTPIFPSPSLSPIPPVWAHLAAKFRRRAGVVKGHLPRVVRILDPPPGPVNVTKSSGTGGTVGAPRPPCGSLPCPGASGRWGSGDSGGRGRVGPRPPRGNPTPVRSKVPELSSPGRWRGTSLASLLLGWPLA